MWKTLKSTVSLCLCLLLLVMPLTASASTSPAQLTPQEQQRLLQIFNELKSSNEILLQDSTKSALDLIQALKELQQSRQELRELKELLVRLQAESMMAKSGLEEANSLLTKASESFKAYQKETDQKINSLRRDRTLWEIVGGIAVGALVYTTVKK